MNKKKIDVLKEKLEIKQKDEKLECCKVCEFKTNSKQGLKTHMARKHTTFEKETFPKQCDLCKNTFETKEEIEKHLLSHSYKSSEKLQFKCDECDFWCPNTESIEAHIKKEHSEKITCGICDYETKDIEVLETHIAACQIYKGCCKEIFKNIPDIKKHVNSKHGGGRWLIKHICIDPKNSEYLVSETHYSDQLFRKYKK